MDITPDKDDEETPESPIIKPRGLLLGVGLDGEDGHTRLTQGDNFRLFGGSQDTHEAMQETALKLNEQLARRGKRIEDCSPRELRDMIERARPRK